MIRESIPQTGSGGAESPSSHGTQLSLWWFQEMFFSRLEGPCGTLWGEKFFEVGGGISVETLMGEEGNLVLNPE